MTVNEVISLVDLKEPNSYTQKEKINWLATLDGKIHEEVIKRYRGYDPENDEFFLPYDGTHELLIKEPWAEDVYVPYLIAKIAQGNAETARYNQQIILYNTAYSQWWAYYNRTHRPLGRPRFRF